MSMTAITNPSPARFGTQLREWRARRRFSQLELANRAEVSTRHLSFLENGRSRPSREMVIHLAEVLDVPLDARNHLLAGAGFSPAYTATALDDAAMTAVREAVSSVLAGHQPNPAVVVDKRWDLVEANPAATLFLAGVDPVLLEPPVNVIRLSLHPGGLARSLVNFDEYADHMVHRLRRQVDRTADPVLTDLLAEVSEWVPDVVPATPFDRPRDTVVVLPMRLRWEGEVLEFFSTIAVFGAPLDVTLDELAIEAFYPADDRTAQVLASMA